MKKAVSFVMTIAFVFAAAMVMSAVSSAGTYGDYTYEDNGDGTVTITGYSGNESSIIIPSSIGGKTVKKIGSKCFQWISVQSITIPSTVTEIHPWAFRGLGLLSSISVSGSDPAFKVVDGCLYSKDMKSLILTPRTIVGNFTVPEGVETIYGSCFHERPYVTSIELPSTLKNIYLFAFRGTEITSITIPASVRFIDEFAFMDCQSLGAVVIPNGVETIYEGTFEGCASLKSITIPTSVTKIESGAFKYCTVLSTVNYMGTAAQWGSITKSQTDNAALFGAELRTAHTVTFKDHDGTILKSEVVQCGGSAMAPADPTRENHSFIGWDKAYTNVTTDIVVNAVYRGPTRVYGTDITGAAGKTATVDISLENNPGITYLELDFTYDTAALRLTGVSPKSKIGASAGVQDVALINGAFTVNWVSASNETDNGVILVLEFEVKEGAEKGNHDITVTAKKCFNEIDEPVEVFSEDVTITVVDYIPGDINGDGEVDGRDVTRLLQHLAQWNVTVVEAALDVNGDGKVDGRDATRLLQYLAHWYVTIH